MKPNYIWDMLLHLREIQVGKVFYSKSKKQMTENDPNSQQIRHSFLLKIGKMLT